MDLYPKVSICIPTYNGEAFIEAAILSAIAQTYPNLEIIISDDDSQDRTVAIAESLINSLPQISTIQIVLLKHERYGLVENWNHCIKYCQTQSQPKYLKFLFQDDLLEPNCVAAMVEVAELDPDINLIFCRRSVTYSSPELLTAQLPTSMQWLCNIHQAWHSLKPIQAGIDLFADPNFLQQPDNKIGEPTAVLIRTEIFKIIGLFDSNFRQFCDLEMWLRIMTYSKIAFVSQELATFRVHSAQTTNLNVASDRVWSEIYQVWLKLVSHPIYQNLSISIRRHIYNFAVKSLLKEYLRCIVRYRWHRLPKIHSLLHQAFRSKLSHKY